MENKHPVRNQFSDDEVLQAAAEIYNNRVNNNQVVSNDQDVVNLLKFTLNNKSREEFAVLFLNSQHRKISLEIMFRGTINQTSVYPREIIRRALELNASAIILSHNHPSGSLDPSNADIRLTGCIKDACQMVDINVLDRIIVSHSGAVSLATRGLM